MSIPGSMVKPWCVREVRFDTPDGPLAALESVPEGEQLGTAVLVPGFTGSKEDFLPLLAPLAEGGIRVVCYDQRGQYESPGLTEPGGYSLARFGADLWDVLEQVTERSEAESGKGPVHLLGHSFGALVVREALLQRGSERPALDTLTILGSGPDRIGGNAGARARVLIGLCRFLTLAQLHRIMPVNKHADPDVSQFLLARWLGNDRASIRAMGHELLTEPDRTDLLAARLREWSLPALVSCGEAETTWPTAQQRQMAERLGAAFVGFPGIGHSPNTDSPELLSAALLDFWLS